MDNREAAATGKVALLLPVVVERAEYQDPTLLLDGTGWQRDRGSLQPRRAAVLADDGPEPVWRWASRW